MAILAERHRKRLVTPSLKSGKRKWSIVEMIGKANRPVRDRHQAAQTRMQLGIDILTILYPHSLKGQIPGVFNLARIVQRRRGVLALTNARQAVRR